MLLKNISVIYSTTMRKANSLSTKFCFMYTQVNTDFKSSVETLVNYITVSQYFIFKFTLKHFILHCSYPSTESKIATAKLVILPYPGFHSGNDVLGGHVSS
jgi:cAMP phosphodiesterase